MATRNPRKKTVIRPSYPGSRFALKLDNSGSHEFVNKYSGGAIKAELGTYSLDGDSIRKHITNTICEPITVEAGIGMSKAFNDWIQFSFERDFVTRNGVIYACNAEFESMAVREFMSAYISEVTLPELDRSSRELVFMTVKFNPEHIRNQIGNKTLIPDNSDSNKSSISRNFRFQLGNLPCERVAKIDSFTWKKIVTKEAVGDDNRDRSRYSSKIEVPNLRLTIAARDLDIWWDWYHRFVVDGQSSGSDELQGTIAYLTPDQETILGKIELFNVGPISIQNFTEDGKNFVVDLYVNQMNFLPE